MKVLLEIVADQSKAAIEVKRLRDSIAQFRKELGKEGLGADRAKELNQELVKTTVQVNKLTEQQKNLNREFKQASVPKDSITGLRLEYAKLTDQVYKLSKAERESAFGKGLAAKAGGIKAEIDGVEQAMGRFTGNVGNYRKSLLSIGDLLTGGLATGGVVVGVQALIGAMKAGVSQAIQYQKALSNLSALTGLQGAGLENLDKIARGLQVIEVNGQRIVNTGPAILEALKLVGGARPELLQDAEALGDVAKNAIILSQASGDDLKSSVEAVTTSLGQFKLQGKDSGKLINELAAGAKEGAAEIPDITKALKEFGTVAEISNASTSNSIALTELLADRQLKGAEAGTQLRNVLSKIASADILPKSAQAQFQKLGIDINVLKDSTLPLETRLRELGKAQGDLSALTKIFGLENLQAATIITSGVDKYVALDKAITGTSEAYRQAGINADNIATKLDNLQKGSLNALEEKFSGATSSGTALLDVLSFMVDKLDIIGLAFDAIVGPIGNVVAGFRKAKEALGFGEGGGKDEFQKASENVSALTTEVERLKAALANPGKEGVLEATQKLTKAQQQLAEAQKQQAKFGDIRKSLQGKSKVDGPVEDFSLADPLFPDFKTGGLADNTDELLKQVNKIKEATDKDTDSKSKNKKESVAAANSVDFFRQEIDKLNKVLNNTPEDSPLLAKLTEQIKTAEANLAQLEKKLDELRNGKALEVAPTQDQINSDLRQSSGGSADFASAGFEDEVGLSDEDRQKIIGDNVFKQDQEVENAEFTRSVNEALAKDLIGLTEEQKKAKIDADKEVAESREELEEEAKKAAFEVAQAISDAFFSIKQNQLNQEKEAELAALDESTAEKVKKAQGNQAEIDKIEKAAAKKRIEIEKKAAKEQKEVAIKQAIVNTALAVLKVFATTGPPLSFILAAATAIIGAAQIATISKQEFAGGGVAKKLGTGIIREKPNAPRTAQGDDILAYVKAGEMVLNEAQQRKVRGIAGHDVFHRAGVPMYAGGGVAHALVSPQQAAFAKSIVTFAEGGVFQQAPQIALQPQGSGSSERIVVVETRIHPDDIKLIARTIATDVADSSQRAIASGLNDANRRNEREEVLAKNRTQ